MKQALVGQEVYREEENSHLGWPDHTIVILEEGEGPSLSNTSM